VAQKGGRARCAKSSPIFVVLSGLFVPLILFVLVLALARLARLRILLRAALAALVGLLIPLSLLLVFARLVLRVRLLPGLPFVIHRLRLLSINYFDKSRCISRDA
jgi:hypothetical protein